MSHTLQEVAQITGKPYAVVKKHAQRGKLGTTRDGRSVLVTDDQLAVYQSAEALDDVAELLRTTDADAQALNAQMREAGNVISRLPSPVLSAILEGMPLMGKPKPRAGGPESFRQISGSVAHQGPVLEPTDDDPHSGKPVGFRWRDVPRWHHASESTWSLYGATWTWNGLLWEGGGSAEGRTLGEEISPASPYAHLRPSSPPRKASG